MKTHILILVILLTIKCSFLQAQGRPSEGRESPRTGESSSSSGSSSSGNSDWGSSSSSSGSSSSSSDSGSSSSSSGGYSRDYDYGSSRPSYSRTSAPTTRRSAPDETSLDSSSSRPVESGRVSNTGNYRRHHDEVTYQPSSHRPVTIVRDSPRTSYKSSDDYTGTIPDYYIYNDWLMCPMPYGYVDGYYFDNYDYYIYQGYRHRYSNEDICDYELVDTRTNTIVEKYHQMQCKDGYDACATKRDTLTSESDAWDYKDYYVCIERVSEKFANKNIDKFPSMTSHLTAEQKIQISQMINGKDMMDLFKEGKSKINKCSIEKMSKSALRCNYLVMVDGKPYPQLDKSVCSNRDTSGIYGCNTNSQMKNAGCLLALAIKEGLCL